MYKIYRYEGEYQCGPYHGGAARNKVLQREFDSHMYSRAHPGIEPDSCSKFHSGYHKCAFETVDDLQKWFSLPARRALSHEGYKIVQLWVTKYHTTKSGRQCYYAESDVVHRRVLFT